MSSVAYNISSELNRGLCGHMAGTVLLLNTANDRLCSNN